MKIINITRVILCYITGNTYRIYFAAFRGIFNVEFISDQIRFDKI